MFKNPLEPGNHGEYTVTRHSTTTSTGQTLTLYTRTPRDETPFQWANTDGWDSQECPPREWAVLDRIPLRQVTLLSGEGAIGKSLLS